MKKVAAVALTAVLSAGVGACGSGAPPQPRLGGGVSATCRLFWTYRSAHGIPVYRSYAAAYRADMVEYRHPLTPGYSYDFMPVLQPMVRITARSSVSIANVEVVFYDGSGAETNHRQQVAVNKVLAGGRSYTTTEAWGLSDPETGDTNAASCLVMAWTRGAWISPSPG